MRRATKLCITELDQALRRATTRPAAASGRRFGPAFYICTYRQRAATRPLPRAQAVKRCELATRFRRAVPSHVSSLHGPALLSLQQHFRAKPLLVPLSSCAPWPMTLQPRMLKPPAPQFLQQAIRVVGDYWKCTEIPRLGGVSASKLHYASMQPRHQHRHYVLNCRIILICIYIYIYIWFPNSDTCTCASYSHSIKYLQSKKYCLRHTLGTL